MKALKIILISFFAALSVNAQINSTVTVKVNGNRNSQLMIDGKNYTLTNTTGAAKYEPIVLTLKPGQHKIQFVRTNQNNVKTKNSKTFSLREGYDLVLTVNGDGSVQTKETMRTLENTGNVTTGAMTDAKFTALLTSVKNQWKTSAKLTQISNAFKNKSNVFTTDQVGQLIELVSGDANRLKLAKESYHSIIDPANFYDLEELLSTDASRNDLRAYVQAYNGNSTGTYAAKGAMTDANFNNLLKQVKNQWKTSSRKLAISNAFRDKNNYFTTDQAGQLIILITPEADRLELAKASYRSIVDTSHFSDLNELLTTVESRNELAQYVYTYNGGVGSIYSTPGIYKTPMTDANFENLYQNIRGQWLPFSKMSALTSAFANEDNYFTTSQAKQLVLLVSDEDNRLDLAKSSYRRITDPANFSLMYEVLPTQAKKDELAAYVKTYK